MPDGGGTRRGSMMPEVLRTTDFGGLPDHEIRCVRCGAMVSCLMEGIACTGCRLVLTWEVMQTISAYRERARYKKIEEMAVTKMARAEQRRRAKGGGDDEEK
jgi:hypothetical protein